MFQRSQQLPTRIARIDLIESNQKPVACGGKFSDQASSWVHALVGTSIHSLDGPHHRHRIHSPPVRYQLVLIDTLTTVPEKHSVQSSQNSSSSRAIRCHRKKTHFIETSVSASPQEIPEHFCCLGGPRFEQVWYFLWCFLAQIRIVVFKCLVAEGDSRFQRCCMKQLYYWSPLPPPGSLG